MAYSHVVLKTALLPHNALHRRVFPPCFLLLQEEMAQAGYRTLCVAQKELTTDQWNSWCARVFWFFVAMLSRRRAGGRWGCGGRGIAAVSGCVIAVQYYTTRH